MEIWLKLDLMQKVFYSIAFIASLVFIMQSILTFLGGLDLDLNTDSDFDHELFSLRNLINFLLGFSWSGIAFYGSIQNKFLLSSLAALIGFAFVVFFFFIIKQIQKLSEDNTFKIENTLEKNASVYLEIPAQGKGKIQVSLNGSIHELNAISETGKIETNAMVKIIKIVNNDLVIVQRI